MKMNRTSSSSLPKTGFTRKEWTKSRGRTRKSWHLITSCFRTKLRSLQIIALWLSRQKLMFQNRNCFKKKIKLNPLLLQLKFLMVAPKMVAYRMVVFKKSFKLKKSQFPDTRLTRVKREIKLCSHMSMRVPNLVMKISFVPSLTIF